MLNLRLHVLILLTAGLVACADEPAAEVPVPMMVIDEPAEPEPEPYIENDGFVLPGSHANILRSYTITVPDEDGFVPGFNLDGLDTEEGDEDSCRQGDFIDPEGRTGIDNQFADLWRIVQPLVGEATEALIQGAVNEGRIIAVIELSGVDDLTNDENVTLDMFRGRIAPDIGNEGLIAPDQTVYVDREFPIVTVNNAAIVDGVVYARPDSIYLPVDILDSYFVIEMERAQLRFTINEEGHFSGHFGGVVNLSSVFDELLASNAGEEAALVQPVFYTYADMEKGPDGCTHASAAFGFEGIGAFVVRYPDEDAAMPEATSMTQDNESNQD
jgi:hypothetical protein